MKKAPLALYRAPDDDRRVLSPVPWELLLDHRLKPITKLVAAILWGHMNPAGVCSPGQDTLSLISGVGVRHVQRAIRQLRDAKWIEVEVRSRGVERLPSKYYACHPHHGRVKRPKVPEQMALSLLTLASGPKLVQTTQVSGRGDTGVITPCDTGVAQTTAVTPERCDGLRPEEQPTDPKLAGWERGGEKWQALMATMRAAHVPTPKAAPRRDGAR